MEGLLALLALLFLIKPGDRKRMPRHWHRNARTKEEEQDLKDRVLKSLKIF